MSTPPLWRSAWPLRLVWLLLPVLAGPALADALMARDRTIQVVSSVSAWGFWAVALAASFVPRSVTLTIVRIVVPGSLATTAWAAIGADRPGWAAVAVGVSAAAVLTLAWPGVSDTFVDGSSYGRERRVALRIPGLLFLGPVPLAWLAVAAGVVGGPLLLAARQWVAGVIALVVGVVLAAVGIRQLHLLSRRWLVFVPAGVVVHDPLTLTEPVLFQRHLVAGIGPASADSSALDATAGALGLVLEIAAVEPFSVGVRTGRERAERDDVHALLVTPTQPAATLAIAAEHRLPVTGAGQSAMPPPTTRSSR